MKLGDVLKKEREKAKLAIQDVATKLAVPQSEYEAIEAGNSDAERWGPILALIAIELETPTSRLVAESGRSSDAKPGQVGALIRSHRERKRKAAGDLARSVGLSAEELEQVEAGRSALEQWAPRFLAFAEAIEQPVFNLFYPCGLPFAEIDDYP